ncbi:hypothetical protein [Mycobacterium numidiamassiliense]|uniref:hypothetical protein n=1 Tax=Mycobacterium numidiamassiliense TaxID=1841861 RepID=UPI001055FF17|nr:hypothetical protein [Mycobacterium numidiamassiliense]
MADALHVNNAGLQALAAHCDAVAASLVATTPPPSMGPAIQATSGAVGTVYAALDGAIIVLSRRAQSTAVKSAAAGSEFAATDAVGARQAAAIGAAVSRV